MNYDEDDEEERLEFSGPTPDEEVLTNQDTDDYGPTRIVASVTDQYLTRDDAGTVIVFQLDHQFPDEQTDQNHNRPPSGGSLPPETRIATDEYMGDLVDGASPAEQLLFFGLT